VEEYIYALCILVVDQREEKGVEERKKIIMTVVYSKFESAKDYFSVPVDGRFIYVRDLKQRIFEAKQLGKGKDFDIVLSNASNR
jgi:hypothetical protein